MVGGRRSGEQQLAAHPPCLASCHAVGPPASLTLARLLLSSAFLPACSYTVHLPPCSAPSAAIHLPRPARLPLDHPFSTRRRSSLLHFALLAFAPPQKECGLHSGNISAASGGEEAQESADLWPSGAVAALDKQQLSTLLDGPREKDTIVALYAPWCQFCKVGPGGVRLWCLCLCCVLLWWPVVLVVLCVLPAGMSLFIYAKERLSLGPCSLILLACSLSCLACSHCTFPPSSDSTFQALEPQYAELADQLAGSHVSVAKFQADTEREFAADKFGLKTFPTLVLLPKGSKGGE